MTVTSATEPLFEHQKRPTWGLAILAWEGPTKRRYQFQDGQLRTFKKGYYELLKRVEPTERAHDVVRDLKSMLRIQRVHRSDTPTPKRVANAVSLDAQIALFREDFPGGFEDPKWLADRRGRDVKKSLKRHREPAIQAAREKLNPDAIGSAKPADVLDAVREVLATTDLASSKDTVALRDLPAESLAAAAAAFVGTLSDNDEETPSSFDALVRALEVDETRVTWPLITALPALLRPDLDVAVKPSVFRQQAQWLAPDLPYDPRPSGALYLRLRRLCREVARRLEDSEMKPADLLDVRDFIAHTLAPKNLRRMRDDRII